MSRLSRLCCEISLRRLPWTIRTASKNWPLCWRQMKMSLPVGRPLKPCIIAPLMPTVRHWQKAVLCLNIKHWWTLWLWWFLVISTQHSVPFCCKCRLKPMYGRKKKILIRFRFIKREKPCSMQLPSSSCLNGASWTVKLPSKKTKPMLLFVMNTVRNWLAGVLCVMLAGHLSFVLTQRISNTLRRITKQWRKTWPTNGVSYPQSTAMKAKSAIVCWRNLPINLPMML